jgi:hypothetical protein
MQKGQKTADKHAKKLGPGGLGTQMETHNSLVHLQRVYCIQWQNKEVEQFWRGEHDIVVLGNRRNLRLLLSECKHLRKNSCAASCPRPLLQLGLCQLSLQII